MENRRRFHCSERYSPVRPDTVREYSSALSGVTVNDQAIRNQIVEMVRRESVHTGEIPDGALADHLDSVQRLTLVVAIEDHFEICLDPNDEEQVETLDDIVKLIQRKLGAA